MLEKSYSSNLNEKTLMNAYVCVFNRLRIVRAKEELLQNLEEKDYEECRLVWRFTEQYI